MDDLEVILKKDYEEAKEKLNNLKNAEHEQILNQSCENIRTQMIEYEKVKLENEAKEKEAEIKKDQNKKERILSYVKIGCVTGLSLIGAILTHKHFKETLDFDRVATSTSTNGRKTINSASSFDPFKLFGFLK